MQNNYLNKTTKRVVGYKIAKKQGLFTNPENFQLPPKFGIDLKSKRVVSFNNLKEKITKNKISLQDVYIPDSHLFMPETKRIVMATPTSKAKQAEQLKPKITYTFDAIIWRTIDDSKNKIKHAGKNNYFIKDGITYKKMIEYKITSTDSQILTYNQKRLFLPIVVDNIRRTRNSQKSTMLPNWYHIVSICKTANDDFEYFYRIHENYFQCIDIKNVQSHDLNKKAVNPLDVIRHASFYEDKVYNKNIVYELNNKAETFKDLFKTDIILTEKLASQQADNSCFINLIHSEYYYQFEKLKPNGKRYFKELTRDYLMQILKLDPTQTNNIGLSIRSSVLFFEKFNLGLEVYDLFNNIIFKFTPETKNKNIFPSVLRCVANNNHIYKINAFEKNLEQTHKNKIATEECISNDIKSSEKRYLTNGMNIGTNYNINDDDANVKHIVIKTLDDVSRYLTERPTPTPEQVEEKIVFVVLHDKIDSLLFEMINEAKYQPSISFKCGMLTAIYFKVGEEIMTIKDGRIWADHETLNVDLTSQSMYDTYSNTFKNTFKQIINKSLKSEYNSSSQAIDNALPMGPCVGYFNKLSSNMDLNAVDMRKAYTHNLMMIENVPKYGVFDVYVDYDDHKVENETLYIVRCIGDPILFPTVISRCYGVKLNYAQSIKIKFEILKFKRPSNLESVNFTTTINNLYASNISSDDVGLKKTIVNTILGMTEKKKNSKSMCKLFSDYSQALHYKEKYGGEIHPFCTPPEYELVRVENTNISKLLDAGVYDSDEDEDKPEEKTYTYKKIRKQVDCQTLYILKIDTSKELTNGFMPIKEMIYEHQKIKLHKLFVECQSKNLKIMGVRTDCIILKETEEDLIKLFDFEDVIGGLKLETNKCCINQKIEQQDPVSIEQLQKMTSQTKVNIIDIKNEYDTQEINKAFDDHNHILIKGKYPGVGKTTAVKNYNKKTLFVSPYNKLCQELIKDNFDAITVNQLIGVKFINDDESDKQDCVVLNKKVQPKKKCYDVSSFEVICFDEMMLYGCKELYLVKNYMANHPNIKFLATGDTKQNKPFTLKFNNVKGKEKYLDQCRDMVFPNQIVLKISKRLTSEEDRKMLDNLMSDTFDKSISIETICKKYGFKTISNLKDLKTKTSITYFKYYVDIINTIIHDRVLAENKSEFKYYPGLELTCYAHLDDKMSRIFVNCVYVINTINTKTFTIKDAIKNIDIEYIFKIEEMDKYFKLNYANTCYAVQGMNIKEEFTIFNSNIDSHCDRSHFWTAITRATDFKNITVFIHGKNEINRLKYASMMRYFSNKVSSYKSQDNRKGRPIDNEVYINAEWIMKAYNKNKTCARSGCNEPFEFRSDDDELVISNMTVQRNDNAKPHNKDNCCLYCLHCNVSEK